MANSKVKHIPQKDSVIQDDVFQRYKTRLESIAVQKGGVSEYFTH